MRKSDSEPLVQHKADIFLLLGSTDTKQRVWNSSCFWDHDATKVVGVITFLHCETSALEFTDFFQFCKYSTHCILQAQRAFIAGFIAGFIARGETQALTVGRSATTVKV